MRRSKAIGEPQDASTDGLIHHSDRGGRYLSIRYTERLAEAEIEPSVGSKGDSYGNASAETTIGHSKTEVIRRPAHPSAGGVGTNVGQSPANPGAAPPSTPSPTPQAVAY